MTDREALTAIYNAIEQLYFELTGKALRVSVETASGRIIIQNFGATSEACSSRGTAPHAV